MNPKGFHISGAEIGAVFAIGIPASVTNLMQSIGIALTNRALLGFGDDKVAAMGIVMKINMIAALVLVGFCFWRAAADRVQLWCEKPRETEGNAEICLSV